MARHERIHFERNHVAGDLMTSSLCGYTNVAVTSDRTRATCRLCLTRLRSGAGKAARARLPAQRLLEGEALASELHLALAEAPLAPHAGSSPRLTHKLWASSCKGGEHRRCGECEICAWEREAQLWAAVSPWNIEQQAERADNVPRWPSLAAALAAVVEHERTGRDLVSTLHATLARAARGERGELQRDPRKTSRPIHQASDVVHVQLAVERWAIASGTDALSPGDCARALLERTAGVLAGVTGVVTYETLSKRYGCGEDLLKSIVKHGREQVTAELVERGLIPAPRHRARAAAGSSWVDLAVYSESVTTTPTIVSTTGAAP